ncbi:Secreted protein OS=Streptomyces tendae OX=1932 GN=GUR47_08645 PE=4 SV=1 [Streptomyces tendae]
MGRAGAATRRRLALGTAVLSVTALLAVAMPQEAQAAAGCAGRKVRTLHFATGSVLVHKRGGYVCAVTVPGKPGTKRQMSVSVRARGGRAVVDAGRFAYRAGPVTVHAGKRCVWVTGKVAGGSVSSGWILC